MGFVDLHHDTWEKAGIIISENDIGIAIYSVTPSTPGSFTVFFKKDNKGIVCWSDLPKDEVFGMLELRKESQDIVKKRIKENPDHLKEVYDSILDIVHPTLSEVFKERSLRFISEVLNSKFLTKIPFGFHLGDNGDMKEIGLMLPVPHYHAIAHHDIDKSGILTASHSYYNDY